MKHDCDCIIVGAGVAGAMTALVAQRHGLHVIVVDDNATPGGQVYRQPSPYARAHVPADAERREGDHLRDKLRTSGIEIRSGHSVWSVTAGFRVELCHDEAMASLSAPVLVGATGATERFHPFEGWTDPAVTGLAAASILLRAGGILPGQRTVVAGSGPLLFSVAHQIMELGGEVAAIVDTASTAQWARMGATLVLDAARMGQGLAWMREIRRRKIPIHHRACVRSVTRRGSVVDVTIRSLAGNGRDVTIAADAVACGYGLRPSTDLSRLLHARHDYDGAAGYWQCAADPYGRSSIDGFYVSGDGAGIRGASVARLRGILSGHAIAHDMGRIDSTTFADLCRPVLSRLRRLDVVSRQMVRLMNPGGIVLANTEADTPVCRCERVSRATIEQAIDDGAHEINQVKSWTRCGMGPCQGRMCEDSVRQLLAHRTHQSPDAVGHYTTRMPLRPLPVQAVTGTYTYADIPLPKAAPL
ncbi:FAD-dependent oxidoreductase [Komagataeibacter melomenusus]